MLFTKTKGPQPTMSGQRKTKPEYQLAVLPMQPSRSPNDHADLSRISVTRTLDANGKPSWSVFRPCGAVTRSFGAGILYQVRLKTSNLIKVQGREAASNIIMTGRLLEVHDDPMSLVLDPLKLDGEVGFLPAQQIHYVLGTRKRLEYSTAVVLMPNGKVHSAQARVPVGVE